MTGHLTGVDLDRLRVARLSAAEVLAMTEHLAGCADCRELYSHLTGEEAARRLLSLIGGPSVDVIDHPEQESRLFPYVEGTLARSLREEVESHLAVCELCREDVADLRALDLRRASRRRWLLPAVASVAAAAVIVVVVRFSIPAPEAPRRALPARTSTVREIATDPWHVLLQSALAAGRLDEPAVLAVLRPRGERVRGPVRRSSKLRAPVGIVVESVRPRFSWTAARGAKFRVSVFDGDRLVGQSPFLPADVWECDRDLVRGRVYSWQVEMRREGARTVMPGPADPDALFQVLDEDAARDVAAARGRYPDDHLLAGVLYAHYGVCDRAEEELQLAAGSPGQAADAARFMDSVRRWQG
jgi:anti-sigma factor RsiW